jgi:predicted regulator of Ras-like GTPase activity (Roadblock/LC7/MglB family)
MTGDQPTPPRNPAEFDWLITDFAVSTPGVSHALIVSSDGLPLVSSRGLSSDMADPLAAMTSGLISLGRSIAERVGEGGCDQVLLRLTNAHFVFMAIGQLAGLAVLVHSGGNLSVVAHRMAQLVSSVGHVLTPQMRDELRRHTIAQGVS